MAVGLVVDYMVHVVHYYLHQARVAPPKAYSRKACIMLRRRPRIIGG